MADMKSHAAAGRGTADTAAGVQTAKTSSEGITPEYRYGDVIELNSAVYVALLYGNQLKLPLMPRASKVPHDSAAGVSINAPAVPEGDSVS
jgi:hypothetical protein